MMDTGSASMQGYSGSWHPHRAASRKKLHFTTRLSRLPQDYWRERNVLKKISQLLLKGTAFPTPFWDGHSFTEPDTLLQLAAPTGASTVTSPYHPGVSLPSWPPLHVQIIEIVISKLFCEEILLFPLSAPGTAQSLYIWAINLRGTPATQGSNAPARCCSVWVKSSPPVQHLLIICQESPGK